MRYTADSVCGGCPYYGENGNCHYTSKKKKDWTYVFYGKEVTVYPIVAKAYGTSICWRKTEAMKIAKARTGSEVNWEQFTSELTIGA